MYVRHLAVPGRGDGDRRAHRARPRRRSSIPRRACSLVGAITVVPVAFAAAAAAAFAVVLGAPKVGSGLTISFPEGATIGLILRQAFPPFLAALAVAPVIAAREAVHQHGDPFADRRCSPRVPALVIAGCVVAFLRTRKSVVF